MKYSMHQQYYNASLPSGILSMAEGYSNTATAECCIAAGQGVEACVPHSGMCIHDGIMGPALASNRKILCQVCGALSSGLHFGVFTCEGCKCFYRRSIKEGANYACAKDRNCDITMETRNSCRFCRFQKCLALGMSKEGIKLGRRPKVDSDVFQQGFYHSGDMEMLHSHGPQTYSWPGADHLATHYPTAFKSEPAFMDLGNHGKERFGEQSILNYPVKREMYTTCDQHNSLHYQHQVSYLMPGQQDGGMHVLRDQHYDSIYGSPMETGVHLLQQVYPASGHSQLHHHSSPMSTPVPIMHSSATQSDGSQSWTAELSPTSSMSSGSEEAWEGSLCQTNLPSSVTLSLPEVHSGAVAAMAYANLYRGKNDSPLSTSSVAAAEQAPEDEHLSAKKPSEISFLLPSELERGSRSYTELVPRRSIQTDSVVQPGGEKHEVIGFANNLPSMQNSVVALSPRPASPACSISDSKAWLGHPDTVRDPAELLNFQHPSVYLKQMQDAHGEQFTDFKRDLVHIITTQFMDLKMHISAQWKNYQGQISIKDAPNISWEEVKNFLNKTNAVTDDIRSYVHKILNLAQHSCTSKPKLVWTSLAIVVKTCLLLDMSSDDQERTGGITFIPQLLEEEAACICILALLSSAIGNDAHLADTCSWICHAAQNYLKEKCKTEERFQQVIQILQGDSTATGITLT